jgi:hypothetical protein
MATTAERVESGSAQTQAAPRSVVALLAVSDVQRSIDFYVKLGFELGKEPLKNEALRRLLGCIMGKRRR